MEPSRDWRLSELPDDNAGIAADARHALLETAPLRPPTPGAREHVHLNYWVAALEQMGVLVLHTQGGFVERKEMRAFSLYFEGVPVIVLNGADWVRGRLFSLIHEYAHLLLHTGGLCDTKTDARAVSEDRRLEARCNAIAADILMPPADIFESEMVSNRPAGHHWTLDELIEAARPFGVSVESFLRRLATLGVVPTNQYTEFPRGKDGPRAREEQQRRQREHDQGEGLGEAICPHSDRCTRAWADRYDHGGDVSRREGGPHPEAG